MSRLINHIFKVLNHSPNKPSFRFIHFDNSKQITFSELRSRVISIATELQSQDKSIPLVLLLYDNGFDFIQSYLSCLLSGLMVVPVLSQIHSIEKDVSLTLNLLKENDGSVVLSTSTLMQKIATQHPTLYREFDDTCCLYTDRVRSCQDLSFSVARVAEDHIVHIIFTSGSTGKPKGVPNTHGQLYDSLKLTSERWNYHSESRTLSWLPYDHIFGITFGYLIPLFNQNSSYILPTDAVISKPLYWLESISAYQITHSGGSNFCYQLCVNALSNRQKDLLIDLSCWQVAVNGGEVVNAHLMLEFSRSFSPYGFNMEKFYPAYGASEWAGLIASRVVGEPFHLLDNNNHDVCLGGVLNNTSIRIIDPESEMILDDGEVGEIHLAADHMIQAYVANDLSMNEGLLIRRIGQSGRTRLYFNTGDMGFIEACKLYIVGRSKEIMVIRGKKYYPNQLEQCIVKALDSLMIQCAVISVIEEQSERCIALVESVQSDNFNFERLTSKIKQTISREVGILLHDVLFVLENSLPRTRSRKIDRHKAKVEYSNKTLPIIEPVSDSTKVVLQLDKEAIEERLIDILLRCFDGIDQIDRNEAFESYGLESIHVIRILAELEEHFAETPASILYEYRTVSELASYFYKQALKPKQDMNSCSQSCHTSNPDDNENAIAIIAHVGRYPGAKNIEELWQNLLMGKSSIGAFPEKRKREENTFADDQYGQGGYIADVNEFDPTFFGITPRDAEIMDPQERIFLMASCMALEIAGYLPDFQDPLLLPKKSIGVFVGAMNTLYQLQAMPFTSSDKISPDAILSSIANRTSYTFNLKGPSITVDTMCSASLTAMHLACESLKRGECSAALVGGVNVIAHGYRYYLLKQRRYLSEKGRCSSFGVDADGYVPGEGVGVVLLKPLKQAIIDKDYIHAVIQGTAINHGGKASGYTVPTVSAQQEVIGNAIRQSGVSSTAISYIEAHAAGTLLGDPVEMEGILSALGAYERDDAPCSVGSIKSNIGHLEAAAGIAGVSKLILQLQNRTLVPSLHSDTLNSSLKMDSTLFSIQKKTEPWITTGLALAGGVSSFGAGGSNAHVIIQEYSSSVRANNRLPKRPYYLLPFSARTKNSLFDIKKSFMAFLTKNPSVEMNNLEYTLQNARTHFKCRSCYIVSHAEELLQCLQKAIVENSLQKVELDFPQENLEKILSRLHHIIDDVIYHKELAAIAKGYIAGLNIDWSRISHPNARIIPLPTYCFQTQSYWYQSVSACTDIKLSYLNDIDSQQIEKGTIFTIELSPTHPLLYEHQVHGYVVLSAAGILELMFTYFKRLSDKNTFRIMNLQLMKPIVLMASMRFSLCFKYHDASWTVLLQEKKDSSIVYAKASITTAQLLSNQLDIDIESFFARARTVIDLYDNFKRNGIFYGKSYQLIQKIGCDGANILAELPLRSERTTAEISQQSLIVYIDAMLQSIGSLQESADNDKHLLPYSIDEFEVCDHLPEKLYIFVSPSEKKYNIFLIDGLGYVHIRMSGIVLRRYNPLKNCLYQTAWCPLSINSQQETPVASTASRYAIMVDYSYRQVASALRDRWPDSQVILINAPESYSPASQDLLVITSDCFVNSVEQLQPCDHLVIYMGHSSADELTAVDVIQQLEIDRTRKLVRELINLSKLPQHRIILLTRQLANVVRNAVCDPADAGRMGFLNAIAVEYPQLVIKQIDLPSDFIKQTAKLSDLLIDAIQCQELVLAIRHNQLYARRFHAISLNTENSSMLARNKVYVLVGGMGGIGRALSQYLLNCYQANVILVGRRLKNMDMKKELEALSAKHPGRVKYYQGDTASLVDLARIKNEVLKEHGSITGVFHLAMVLDNKKITDLNESALNVVCLPKISGSVACYECFKEISLDFMLFFSSVSAWFPFTGQAAYAAANYFQDSYVASLSAASNFPVKVIHWGYWGSIGAVAHQEYQSYMSKQGVESIEPMEAMFAVEHILSCESKSMIVYKATAKKLRSLNFVIPINTKINSYAEISHQYLDCQTLLEEAVIYKLLRLFQSSHIFEKAGDYYDEKILRNTIGVIDSHEKLFTKMLSILTNTGLLEKTGARYRATSVLSTFSIKLDEGIEAKILKTIAQKYPNALSIYQLLDDCSHRWMEVISGKLSAFDIFFPSGQLNYLDNVYSQYLPLQQAHVLCAELIVKEIHERLSLFPTKDIVVLEVGAGVGSTLKKVLNLLGPDQLRVTYIHSDVSDKFAEFVKNTLNRHYNYLDYRIYDFNQAGVEQGFEPGSIDIIVASNCLHVASNLSTTFNHFNLLLAPQGKVIFEEVTYEHPFFDVTFGLMSGWWAYQEEKERFYLSPLLSVTSWQSLISALGFRLIDTILPEVSSDKSILPSIITVMKTHELSTVLAKDGNSHQDQSQPEKKSVTIHQSAIEIIDYVHEVVSDVIKLDKNEIDIQTKLSYFGVDSIIGLDIVEKLKKRFGDIKNTLLFEYETVAAIGHYLAELISDHSIVTTVRQPDTVIGVSHRNNLTCIIGLAGYYPDANTIEQFWLNLLRGKKSFKTLLKSKYGLQAAALLNRKEKFDALFFSILPNEIDQFDLQELYFLEVVYNAIENAGYTTKTLAEQARVGVFVGVSQAGRKQSIYGQWSIANRVSYTFDFKGPCITIDTSCVSSLTALHQAIDSIQRGDCDYAVVGAVNLIKEPAYYECLESHKLLSNLTYSRPFALNGDGFIIGEGVGAIIVTYIERAMKNLDYVYANIHSSSIGSGGRTTGYLAPSVKGQISTINNAVERAVSTGSQVQYIEAMASGVSSSDDAEVQALASSLLCSADCMPSIGTVEGNIGHLEAASGMASLTKTCLSLSHGIIPQTITENEKDLPFNLVKHNKNIDINLTDISIHGYSAGGSTAHVILGAPQHNPRTISASEKLTMLFPFSAKDEKVLLRLLGNTLCWLDQYGDRFAMRDMAYTLACCREHMKKRIVIMADSKTGLLKQLQSICDNNSQVHTYDLRGFENKGKLVCEHNNVNPDLVTLAQHYLGHKEVDWSSIYEMTVCHKVPLNGYPFQ